METSDHQRPSRRRRKISKRASVSITEVAKIAGVSTATVSRVINKVPDVRPETADQVHAAMRSIGYTPPKVRRGPKLGPRSKPPRVGQIAVVTVGSGLRSFEM